ncbi:MAG: DsbA family protein [Oligoflexia bacterium]|nr:DsbA family protein [Oligoflexia bacterium]
MQIDLYLDMTCPWCYIGFKRLQNVFNDYSEHPFELKIIGYQLNDTIPLEGIYYSDLYSSMITDPEKRKSSIAKITEIGRSLQIDFRYDLKLINCHTLYAHRLLKRSPQEKKIMLLEAIFKGIFTEGKNLSDINTLMAISEICGIASRAEIESFLRSNEMSVEVQNDFKLSESSPIITIPYVVVDNTYSIQAVHLPEVLSSCIRNLL